MFNLKFMLQEIFLLTMACLILLIDLFVPQKNRTLTYILTQLSLIVVAIITICLYNQPDYISEYGLFVHDKISHLLNVSVCISSVFVFLYSRDYIRQHDIA